MVIDSHEHIMFPIKMQLDKMDAAGVDKTILFCTAPHPEKADTLNELEAEMAALNKILSGSNTKEDNISRLKKNIAEVVEAVRTYPDRFLGFGAVPLGMESEEAEEWIDTQITSIQFEPPKCPKITGMSGYFSHSDIKHFIPSIVTGWKVCTQTG